MWLSVRSQQCDRAERAPRVNRRALCERRSTFVLQHEEDPMTTRKPAARRGRTIPAVAAEVSVASEVSAEGSLAALVLGMHRSGTSAVTRMINLLGVPLNVSADWMPEIPRDNPTGFWESVSLCGMNDEILEKLGGSWDLPPRLERGWPADPRLVALRATAPAACEAVFPTEQWVWKDPRNCLTLPFWLDALDVTPVIVLVHRSPVEVALSLLRRNAISVNHSLALWERYVRTSLEAAARLPAYVLDYERLLDDPIGSATDLQQFLASMGFKVVGPDEAVVRSFVSSQLRHSSFPDPNEWSQFGVSPEQRVLHAALSSAVGPHEALKFSEIGPETLATEALFQHLRVDREASRTLAATARSLDDHRAETAELAAELTALRAETAGLPAELTALRAETAELAAELTALRAETAELAAELTALRAETAGRAAELTALGHQVAALERSAALRLLTAPGRLAARISRLGRDRASAPQDGGPL
jgi:hypothetical protein